MTISYEEFGRRLIEAIVTADRVEEALKGFASGAFETSVKLAAGLVRAEGAGEVTRIHVDSLLDDDLLVFVATLHVDMQVLVRVSGVPSRYTATGKVTLVIRPLIDDDLSIVIDIPKITEADVSLKLRPSGTVASIIDQLGSVEEQVRREIVKFVNKRKDAPDAQQLRRIDVGGTIVQEWERLRG